MANYDEQRGAWVDNSGGVHNTEQEASKADANSNWLGMAGGNILLFVLLILPILTAKLIGFIFGLLTHLRSVGRILQTVIMAILLMFVAAMLADMAREGDLPGTIIKPFQIALVIIPSVWYFLWHFNAMRYMGASEFSRQFKTLCTFLWFGIIGGYVWGMLGSMATGAVIAYIVIAIGIWFYIRKTRPYAQAAAEADDDSLIKSNALKRTVMLIAICVTVALGIFTASRQAIRNARYKAEMEEQLKKQVPGGLPLETPYEATLKSDVKALKAEAGSSTTEVTIPAGTKVTVSTYRYNDGVYEVLVNYKEGGKATFIIEDLSVINLVAE